MFESIMKFFNKLRKKEEKVAPNSKEAAKERLHLVLMQDRANVSADFLELMKQEIIEVIKKYIDIDEGAIDVRLTNKENEDGTNGAPALYANIPILNIKNEARKMEKQVNKKEENNKKEQDNKKESQKGIQQEDKQESREQRTKNTEQNKNNNEDKQENDEKGKKVEENKVETQDQNDEKQEEANTDKEKIENEDEKQDINRKENKTEENKKEKIAEQKKN